MVPQGDQPICWRLASVVWVGCCLGGVQTRGWRGSGHRSYHPLINAAARRTLIIVPEFSSVFVDILIIITSHYVSAVVNSLMYTVCGLAVSTDTFISDLSVMLMAINVSYSNGFTLCLLLLLASGWETCNQDPLRAPRLFGPLCPTLGLVRLNILETIQGKNCCTQDIFCTLTVLIRSAIGLS